MSVPTFRAYPGPEWEKSVSNKVARPVSPGRVGWVSSAPATGARVGDVAKTLPRVAAYAIAA
jgi:hypothetical protein